LSLKGYIDVESVLAGYLPLHLLLLPQKVILKCLNSGGPPFLLFIGIQSSANPGDHLTLLLASLVALNRIKEVNEELKEADFFGDIVIVLFMDVKMP